MSDRSRLLMIAYYFPPLGMGGVQRPLKLAKYLPEFGWDVTVITVAEAAYYARDESLLLELPSSVTVNRVKVRDPGHWLRLHTLPKRATGSRHTPPPAWARKIQQMARWPDDKFPFVRPAVRAAESMHAATPFDAVLTTSPPPSVHAAGMRLQKRLHTPWLADFRDPWLVREGDWGPTRIHERYAKRLRAQIISNADAIIATNNAIASSLESSRPLGPQSPLRPLEVIPNGYDEADFKSAPITKRNDDAFRILLYGTLSTVVDPAPALRMIAEWRKRSPNTRMQITHVGLSIGIDTDAIARDVTLQDAFESLGYLPHRDAIAQLCEADAILIPLTTTPGFESTVPGRLFEAMRSLRPILLVGPPQGETARILEDIENTWVVSPDDLDSGIGALERIASLRTGQPAREIASIAQFERRVQAGRFAMLMDSLKRADEGHNA